MRRVYIRGTSGSGKSTLGRALAARLGVPHIELDEHYHLPGWRQRPVEEFRARVADLVAEDAWVMDGNYSKVRDLVQDRADTVIWLDYPRGLVFRRVLLRTLHRCLTGTPVCNGNRENFVNSFLRKDSVVWWSWTTHARRHQEAIDFMADPAYAHVQRLLFCNPQETEAWLQSVPQRS